MLSDAEKRKIYDQFGEEGLKGGIPPGAGGAGGMPQGFHFSSRSPEDIFAEVGCTSLVCTCVKITA